MAYISNPNEISFNGESLRGFVIEEINDEKIEINDIEVKFQINRAIVFDIVIDRNDIDKNELKTIKGRFYSYKFFATIFLQFSAYSCRKVSKNDKFAAKSNNFWEFMLDIVEKVLTLQRI